MVSVKKTAWMLIVQPLHQAIPPGGSPPAFSRDFLCLLQRLSEGQLGLQGFGRVRVGQRGRGVGVVRGEDAPGEAGGADLDLGGPEGVVAEPQLPDDPAVVVVLLRVGEVVAVQVALETAALRDFFLGGLFTEVTMRSYIQY